MSVNKSGTNDPLSLREIITKLDIDTRRAGSCYRN